MGHFGLGELIIIAVLVIVIFGGRKLPELGKGLGQGLANFRRAVREPGKSPSESEGGPNAPESDKASSDEKADRPN